MGHHFVRKTDTCTQFCHFWVNILRYEKLTGEEEIWKKKARETFTENRSSLRTRVNRAGSDGRCRTARAGETGARRVGFPECPTHREKQLNTLRTLSLFLSLSLQCNTFS